MRKKRVFDLVMTTAGALVWVPVVAMAALLVLLCSGRPIFYRSMRRVSADEPVRVVKFRTMVRNAAQIANRETVSVEEAGTRFLNIPGDSPLYTKIGRLLEKVALTELPQFTHVLRGQMSLIGNRPLPQNVMDCLGEEFADVEDRFLTPAGLTGPSQLVGRDFLSDADRLMLEGAYCRGSLRKYSIRLDLLILLYTILIVLRIKQPFTPEGVVELVNRYTTEPIRVPAPPKALEPAPVLVPASPWVALHNRVSAGGHVAMIPAPRTTSGSVAFGGSPLAASMGVDQAAYAGASGFGRGSALRSGADVVPPRRAPRLH
ncbi:sugar transferase [Nocardioides sp. AE5]|uniref:sugar transferase n=1 Tax=Nocardioides sp. AE5 TaxID=2962573 RepID=UPI0028810FA7|nr:sugar transferase [Nocardioides sp. AE5]MDT0202588.1 sugar transferase [Nocardioides sp. AE5]